MDKIILWGVQDFQRVLKSSLMLSVIQTGNKITQRLKIKGMMTIE